MTALDTLARRNPLPGFRWAAWLAAALVTGFVVWASWAKVDEVSTAEGMLVPKGQVKVIQHLEGGIVEEIAVAEGDTVTAGQLLLRLSLGVNKLDPQQIGLEMAGLQLTRARLLAEGNGTALAFPEAEAVLMPDVVQAERQTYEERRLEVRNRIDGFNEKVNQKTADLRGLEGRRAEVSRNLSLAQQQLAISSDLLASGLTSRNDHLAVSREVQGLQTEIRTINGAIGTTRAAIAEARRRVEEEQQIIRRTALEELSRVEVTIARLKQRLSEADDQSVRTAILSPIDGVVKSLAYNTVGGVVGPGAPIMEIVPVKDTLVVEAQLLPTDRGYVREGMTATVKVSSYDFVRYGGVDGTVVQVGADSKADPNSGAVFFPVQVEIAAPYIGGADDALPLTAGMQAVVDIHTGERTVLEYLINPILKLRSDAFRER